MDYLKILWRINMKKSITTIHPQPQKKQSSRISVGWVWIQFLLTIALVILGIVTIFQPELLLWFQLLLGITLLDMGLNNLLFYKRKYVTLLYVAVGVIIIVLFILKLVGV